MSKSADALRVDFGDVVAHQFDWAPKTTAPPLSPQLPQRLAFPSSTSSRA
jgi:hypothetical protein